MSLVYYKGEYLTHVFNLLLKLGLKFSEVVGLILHSLEVLQSLLVDLIQLFLLFVEAADGFFTLLQVGLQSTEFEIKTLKKENKLPTI